MLTNYGALLAEKLKLHYPHPHSPGLDVSLFAKFGPVAINSSQLPATPLDICGERQIQPVCEVVLVCDIFEEFCGRYLFRQKVSFTALHSSDPFVSVSVSKFV